MKSFEEKSFEEKVAFLSRPDSWPQPTRSVAVVRTHLACVFLTESRAFKLKRPIRYHDVDFTSVEGRRQACEREVSLNRRLAGDVYHGIIPLLARPDGTLTFRSPGTPVDWLVEMTRLPLERMLDRAIERGDVRESELRAVARTLATFHAAEAPAECDPQRHVARLARLTHDDLAALRGHVDGIPEAVLSAIAGEQSSFLAEHADLVEERVRSGRVIEGHGDLRPEHICLLEPPVIIDCLEFDGDLRTLDALSDIAFLVLECERLDAPEVGRRLLADYCRAADDHPDPRLVLFYRRQHACARAKLAVWHTHDPGPRGIETWRAKARAYLHLASRGMTGLAA